MGIVLLRFVGTHGFEDNLGCEIPPALRRVGLYGSRSVIAARTKRRRSDGTVFVRPAKLPYAGITRIRFEGSVSTGPSPVPPLRRHFNMRGCPRPVPRAHACVPTGDPGSAKAESARESRIENGCAEDFVPVNLQAVNRGECGVCFREAVIAMRVRDGSIMPRWTRA